MGAEAGDLPGAHALLKRIQEDGIDPTWRRMIYNTVIKACVRTGECQVADLYYKAMIQERVAPSERTYGKLIHCAAAAGRFDEAMRWFQGMTDARHSPDAMCYSMMVKASARAGHLKTAENWLEVMRSKDLAPDHSAITAVLEEAL